MRMGMLSALSKRRFRSKVNSRVFDQAVHGGAEQCLRLWWIMSLKAPRLTPKSHPLTEAEHIALRNVASGAHVPRQLCRRLEKLGTIEASGGGWVLTADGHIRLMFDAAR
jgi:hypothetical protein